jgi:hypothetical protein
LPKVEELERKKSAVQKLGRLSEMEQRELAALLHKRSSLRQVTFDNLVKLTWRSIIVVFVVQVIQLLVAEL